MRSAASLLVLLAACGLTGCGGEDAPPVAVPSLPPCAAPEVALADGTCIRPGIPVDGCAEGFEHDGEYGCNPVLPPDACGPGLTAVPGDAACRPVMPCGAGKWGDIPLEATTVYVDASYAGADSDGTPDRPWTTIEDAIVAATDGAIVAIAEGSYEEDVVVAFKTLRLWGVCPERVEIVGSGGSVGGCPPATLCVRQGASATEVRGLALRGGARGLILSGAENVVADRLWIHDTGHLGISVENTLGPTSITLLDSLVERTTRAGVWVMGAEARIEGTAIRDTLPGADQTRGVAVVAIPPCAEMGSSFLCDATPLATIGLKRSLVERSRQVGVLVSGTATIEGSVIRGTLPHVADGTLGWGIAVTAFCTNTPAAPGACDYDVPSTATIVGSVVEANQELGVTIMGSHATVDRTVIRDTLPGPADLGRGLAVQLPCIRAMDALVSCDTTARSTASLVASVVANNRDMGVYVGSSDLTLESSVVRGTQGKASDGSFGDGVSVISEGVPAQLTANQSLVRESTRAGISSFGALVSLAGVAVDCAAFELEGEPFANTSFEFDDRGNNACRCTATDPPEASAECVAVSANLAPPGSATGEL